MLYLSQEQIIVWKKTWSRCMTAPNDTDNRLVYISFIFAAAGNCSFVSAVCVCACVCARHQLNLNKWMTIFLSVPPTSNKYLDCVPLLLNHTKITEQGSPAVSITASSQVCKSVNPWWFFNKAHHNKTLVLGIAPKHNIKTWQQSFPLFGQ